MYTYIPPNKTRDNWGNQVQTNIKWVFMIN